jgi:hypothetical protein
MVIDRRSLTGGIDMYVCRTGGIPNVYYTYGRRQAAHILNYTQIWIVARSKLKFAKKDI